ESQQKILDQKKQIAAFELDVKTKEAEIQKIQGAQGQSRTNEEFRAFGEHVNRLRKENRALEDRILECLGVIEQIERDSADLKKQRDALKAEAEADAEQWKKDEVSYQEDLVTLAQKRAEFVKSLPPGPLSTYERVLKARDGKAVVAAE